jgi:glycosyltransferase domain-containing protein
MNSNLEKLTILLYVKDRLEFTLRCLSYYNNSKPKVSVIIADGSCIEDIEPYLPTFENINYQYIKCACDKSYSDFYLKILTALKEVKTEFVVFAEDDDFYCHDGLSSTVSYMSKNKEIVACGGDILKFFVLGGDVKNPYYGNKVSYIRDIKARSIAHESSLDRVTDLLSSYFPVYYYTYRIEILIKLMKIIVDINPFSVRLYELLLASLTLAEGKTHHIDTPYLLRQINTTTSCNVEDAKATGELISMMSHELWSNEYINSVIKIIVEKNTGLGTEKKIITKAFSGYFLRANNGRKIHIDLIKKLLYKQAVLMQFLRILQFMLAGKYTTIYQLNSKCIFKIDSFLKKGG